MKHPLLTLAALTALSVSAENITPLDLMDLSNVSTGWRDVGVNRSAEGNALTVGKRVYASGLGVHAPSKAVFDLEGQALRFETTVGVDDESFGTVTFRILGDGRLLWDSGALSTRSQPRTKDAKVDLVGVQILTLEVTDFDGNRDGDHADWLDAKIVFKDGAYGSEDPRQTRQLGVLTPAPAAAPRVNGPTVLGVRPNHPVLWRIAATGSEPLALTVSGLPKGLSFDRATRVISGRSPACGDYPFVVTAKNARGTATKTLTLKVGDCLNLTPARAWRVPGQATPEAVRATADAILSSGLADHGWTLLTAEGALRPASSLGDVKALADALHAKGLRFGLGAVPLGHETTDVPMLAAWGCDAVTCVWSPDAEEKGTAGLARQLHPILRMGRALAACDRDIAFALDQGGALNVATWGRCVQASSWRVTGVEAEGWRRIVGAANAHRSLWHFSAPGQHNDFGPLRFDLSLTPNERYALMTLAVMLATPLTVVCDISRPDPFTLGLFTNDEVLDISADPLCAAATCVASRGRADVWVRPLADGAIALALVNRDMREAEIAADLATLGLDGSWNCRDCWRQADEGVVSGRYAKSLPGHAAHLVRLTPTTGARLRPGLKDVRDNGWLAIFAAALKANQLKRKN